MLKTPAYAAPAEKGALEPFFIERREPAPHAVFPAAPLIMQRRPLAGSLIGGIRQTQETLDFCAAKGIAADVEVVPMEKTDEAFERMLKSDVRYRFVIDLASLRESRGG